MKVVVSAQDAHFPQHSLQEHDGVSRIVKQTHKYMNTCHMSDMICQKAHQVSVLIFLTELHELCHMMSYNNAT